jgi:Amt family ammonium transporter
MGPYPGLDFAGGLVVHASSGVSALVCALFLGKRVGYGKEPIVPHNMTYTAIGAALLWVGWFGFNAGSEIAADNRAVAAFVVTHVCAAAALLSWTIAEWIVVGKPSVLGASSGIVAGLVVITPASGYVNPTGALIMGAIAGVVCFIACAKLKPMLGYDDSLDAFGVHGIGGITGALLTGVFATETIMGRGLVPENLLFNQAFGVLVTVIYAIVGSVILLTLISVTIGLRVSEETEIEGLDVREHGESGYVF